ncbi:MAG: imidazolonepropionase [Parasphingopyxis sp.]
MPHQIYTDATLATLSEARGWAMVADGAIAIDGDRIAYAGAADSIPGKFADFEQTSLGGRLVTPGLIDCHTHLVYAGSRAREFALRLEGASYEDIARAGGGIFSTVEATRSASEEALLAGALARLDRLLAEGVCTVEIKSGYGLDRETELRMLRVAARLAELRPVRISKTFLGAHAIPKDMDADQYLDGICLPTLREAAAENLVDMVDGFCENIAFSPAQIRKVFDVAVELGLPVKLHAEQLSDQGGAALAAEYGALSAEHLEFVSEDGIAAMAGAGTVAVILPGAFYFLGETRKPPIEAFRKAGVPMALATDSNPGSSPMTSLLLAMNMGATLFGLTPEECLRGGTVNAARALGLRDLGRLVPGQMADLAIWDVTDPAELTYRMGDAQLHKRIFGGVEC